MVDSLVFTLLDDIPSVRPVLKASRTVKEKDYIVTVEFEGGDPTLEKSSVPLGLQWSTSLRCPFTYLPATEDGRVTRLTAFEPPIGTTTITLTIRPWGTAAPNQPSPYSDAVLEATLLERTSLIIGEEI